MEEFERNLRRKSKLSVLPFMQDRLTEPDSTGISGEIDFVVLSGVQSKDAHRHVSPDLPTQLLNFAVAVHSEYPSSPCFQTCRSGQKKASRNMTKNKKMFQVGRAFNRNRLCLKRFRQILPISSGGQVCLFSQRCCQPASFYPGNQRYAS